ncbi:hypothetical protein FRC08_008832, partial [Ceratobasidium sp. 394]
MHRRKTSKDAAENGNGDAAEQYSAEDRSRTPSAEPEVPPTTGTPNGHDHSSPRPHTLPGYGSNPRLPLSPSRSQAPQRSPSLNTYDRAPPSAPSNRQSFGALAPPVTSIPMNRHTRAPSVYEPLYGNPP